MMTNEISEEMEKEQNRIIYTHEPLYSYPVPVTIDISSSLEKSTAYVQEHAKEQKNKILKTHTIQKDIDRITQYYSDLLTENEKKQNRKGITEKKIQDLNSKKETIKLEKDKQLQEIYSKHKGQIEINLDNGILYFIPLLEFQLEIKFREDTKEKIVYYNPITKNFF